MRFVRVIHAAVVAAVLAGALGGCKGEATPRKPSVVPMPPDGSILAQLGVNYGMLSVTLRNGKPAEFSEYYADSADFAATGFGSAHGAAEIGQEFATQGPRLGVKEFLRASKGFTVSGRVVRDSGTYELAGAHATLKTDPDLKGLYWTVWRYTDSGKWQVLADTLIGARKQRKDLVPRPVSSPQR